MLQVDPYALRFNINDAKKATVDAIHKKQYTSSSVGIDVVSTGPSDGVVCVVNLAEVQDGVVGCTPIVDIFYR